ncbi:3-5 exonuclease helicase [Diplodia corticola]|uniref:3-5 exonuclease helicase n=1 Tax=Diplodia corticola TaxID=236234 RepID=A0A1J9QXS5_9PEZI|nr:3-5 exonuclease helicase [Diplodia corticola]OJD32794.1 3-5 exonuclease helicase [Diplodia corticola]
MTLSRAIGRAPCSAASTVARSSSRLSLSHARHFRSTPSSLFNDFGDVEKLMRNVHRQKTEATRPEPPEPPERSEALVAAVEQTRSRLEKAHRERRWLRARKDLAEKIEVAGAASQVLREAYTHLKQEHRINAQSSSNIRPFTERYDSLVKAIRVLRSEIHAFEQDRVEQERRIDAQSSSNIRPFTERYDSLVKAIRVLRSEIHAFEQDRVEQERRIDAQSSSNIRPFTERYDSLVKNIRVLCSEIHAVEEDRVAKLQAVLGHITTLKADLRSMFAAWSKACEKMVDRLDVARRQLEYDLEKIKLDSQTARDALLERAQIRETAESLKAFTRSVKQTFSESWLAMDLVTAVLKARYKRSMLLLNNVREDSSDLRTGLDTTRDPKLRQLLFSTDDMYRQIIPDIDHLCCKPREASLMSWRQRSRRFLDVKDGTEEAIHDWEQWRYDKVYKQINPTAQRLIDGFGEFASATAALNHDFKDLYQERKFGPVASLYRTCRILTITMNALNQYLYQDMVSLRVRHEIKSSLEDGDLITLRKFRILDVVIRTSREITKFSHPSREIASYYDEIRRRTITAGGNEPWHLRQAIVDKARSYHQTWSTVRDTELKDVTQTVDNVCKALKETSDTSDLDHLVNYAKERLVEAYEERSFFDEGKAMNSYFSPSIMWIFMRSWPEKFLEAGMALFERQVNKTEEELENAASDDIQDLWSDLRSAREGWEMAKKLAEERRQEQCSLLKLAGVDQEPRYYLDTTLATQEATEERSKHAYFSHKLYRANPAKDDEEHVLLRLPPKLLYHTSNVTHAEVLKGFRGKSVGFDLRWNPGARSEDGPKANTSLLMIATDSTIHLIHLALQSDLPPLLLHEVRVLLESRDVVKATVDAEEKCARLREFLDVNPQGFVDLEDLHYRVQKIKTGRDVRRSPLALQRLTSEYLGYGLHPKAIDRTFDPTLRLRQAEKEAMGSSVYACFALWNTMNREHRTIWERQQVSSEAPAPQLALSEEDEDYFGKSKSERPGPAVLAAAKAWVDGFLAKSGKEDVNSSDGDSRRRRLLSYCLWHYGGYDVSAMAQAVSPTMVNMLLEAIHRETVPYDETRASELLQWLPDGVASAQYPEISRAVRFSNRKPAQAPRRSRLLRDRSAFREAWRWAAEFRESSSDDGIGDSTGLGDDEGSLLQQLCMYRMYHHHLMEVSEVITSIPGGILPPQMAKLVLSIISRERLPYRENDVKKLLVEVHRNDFGDFRRTILLKQERDAVVKISKKERSKQAREVVEKRAIKQLQQRRKRTREAHKWARSGLDKYSGRLKQRYYGVRFYHRLWHHYGVSMHDLHTKYTDPKWPGSVALYLANAIKIFGMPPGDEEQMAELRGMLEEDEHLSKTMDILPSSASAIEDKSAESVNGDVKKHRPAAEKWAVLQMWRVDPGVDVWLREMFLKEHGRQHTRLTYYRLWHRHRCSVAALQEEYFPGAVAPMMKRKTMVDIAEGIMEVLTTVRSLRASDGDVRDLLAMLPEEMQQRYQQWPAKGADLNASVSDNGGQVEASTMRSIKSKSGDDGRPTRTAGREGRGGWMSTITDGVRSMLGLMEKEKKPTSKTAGRERPPLRLTKSGKPAFGSTKREKAAFRRVESEKATSRSGSKAKRKTAKANRNSEGKAKRAEDATAVLLMSFMDQKKNDGGA